MTGTSTLEDLSESPLYELRHSRATTMTRLFEEGLEMARLPVFLLGQWIRNETVVDEGYEIPRNTGQTACDGLHRFEFELVEERLGR